MTNSIPPKKQPVILVARPAAGGIRTHLISLLTHLDRDKFEITLAAPDSLLKSLPKNLPDYEPAALTIASKPSPLDILAAVNLAQLVRATPDSIVHAHGVRAGIVASIARQIAGFRLIVTHHNIPPTGVLSQIVLELIDFGCAATIAVSNAIAQNLPGTDTRVIPNGIDLTCYANLSRQVSRAELGIDGHKFIAAFLGRLSPEKGADLIIRTALLCPETQFLIGGAGPQHFRLQRNCPSNVDILGPIPDPLLLLSSADVVLIPSRTEGQGIVALEAMACGTPVIASRVGGLIETLEQSGGGILVDPESPTQIARALNSLRTDHALSQSLAETGKTWVNSHADIHQRIRELESLYSNV